MSAYLSELERHHYDPFDDDEEYATTPRTPRSNKKKKKQKDRMSNNSDGHVSNEPTEGLVESIRLSSYLSSPREERILNTEKGVIEILPQDVGLALSFFCWWPKALILQVFCHLTEQELKNVSLVCKDFARLANDPVIWKSFLTQKGFDVGKIEKTWRAQISKHDEIPTNSDYIIPGNFWRSSYFELQSGRSQLGRWKEISTKQVSINTTDSVWLQNSQNIPILAHLSDQNISVVDHLSNKSLTIVPNNWKNFQPKFPIFFQEQETLLSYSERYGSLVLSDLANNSNSFIDVNEIQEPVSVICASKRKTQIFTAHKTRWALWSVGQKKNLANVHALNPTVGQLRALDYNPDIQKLVVGSGHKSKEPKIYDTLDFDRGIIRLYDVNNHFSSSRKFAVNHSRQFMPNVDNLKILPEQQLLIAQVGEKMVFQFDLRSKEYLQSVTCSTVEKPRIDYFQSRSNILKVSYPYVFLQYQLSTKPPYLEISKIDLRKMNEAVFSESALAFSFGANMDHILGLENSSIFTRQTSSGAKTELFDFPRKYLHYATPPKLFHNSKYIYVHSHAETKLFHYEM